MKTVLLTLTALLISLPLQAAPADLIGKPTSLEVDPPQVTLQGPRASAQILITGKYADGSERDLTALSQWKAANAALITLSPHGFVEGVQDGQTNLEVSVAGLSAQIPVVVQGSQSSQPMSFRQEMMPVLSAAGCSDIRCHGAPSGKNGFRLSLWGHDSDLDMRQLTREAYGRRTNALNPSRGLIYLKATGQVPHVGRKRFDSDSRFAEIFRTWQEEGLRDDPEENPLASLVVSPSSRVLLAPAQSQQLSVTAIFADGGSKDVTRLATFAVSDVAVAEVGRTGLIDFKGQGEVAVLCRFMGQMQSVRLMHIASPSADYHWPEPPQNNYVDRHVFAKLERLNIPPSDLCSDSVFVRRVYLDLCGVLPTPEETQAFVSDESINKRSRLIDELLQRPEYADYWTKKWLDVLRVSRDSIQLAGATAYHGWLRERIEKDASFAEVVQAMLTSTGESFTDPAANFYAAAPMPRKPEDKHYLQKDLAEATGQLFLGVRLQCAQCHNHPYERWTQDDYLSLAAFFTQIKRTRLGKAGPAGRPERREIAVALELKSPEFVPEGQTQPKAPHTPGEPPLEVTAEDDRRQVLADWLTQADNPFFAKAIVNRVWYHLHGRGIVEPVDDFRDSNPSVNDPLLAALAKDFVASGFRLKPLIRTIMNARTYQLSAKTNEFNVGDTMYFSHPTPRPLPAEVLLDAICNVTDAPESFEITKDFTIGVPEGTVKLPPGTRAVQLPVTDIATLINTSGKYVRYELHPFLRTFGQPKRAQTCECDREQAFGQKQALEMIVGPLLTAKLAESDNRLGGLLADESLTDEQRLRELYLRALSRPPTDQAAESLLKYITESDEKRQAWEDVLWTVLNSQEFVYQH